MEADYCMKNGLICWAKIHSLLGRIILVFGLIVFIFIGPDFCFPTHTLTYI